MCLEVKTKNQMATRMSPGLAGWPEVTVYYDLAVFLKLNDRELCHHQGNLLFFTCPYLESVPGLGRLTLFEICP